jgi:hypothetical protein
MTWIDMSQKKNMQVGNMKDASRHQSSGNNESSLEMSPHPSKNDCYQGDGR